MPVFDDFVCDNGCKDEDGNPIKETHTKADATVDHKEHLCPKCEKPLRKLFGSPAFDVAEGKLGNAKNGYSSGYVGKPSHFGRYKGKKVK